MSLTPAYDELEARRIREAVELCGKNRGPHDYIPIEWSTKEHTKRVTRLFCRVCFSSISVKAILDKYPEIKL